MCIRDRFGTPSEVLRKWTSVEKWADQVDPLSDHLRFIFSGAGLRSTAFCDSNVQKPLPSSWTRTFLAYKDAGEAQWFLTGTTPDLAFSNVVNRNRFDFSFQESWLGKNQILDSGFWSTRFPVQDVALFPIDGTAVEIGCFVEWCPGSGLSLIHISEPTRPY